MKLLALVYPERYVFLNYILYIGNLDAFRMKPFPLQIRFNQPLLDLPRFRTNLLVMKFAITFLLRIPHKADFNILMKDTKYSQHKLSLKNNIHQWSEPSEAIKKTFILRYPYIIEKKSFLILTPDTLRHAIY